MCQYINVTQLINALPEDTDCIYSSNHYRHPEIKIEIPICVARDELLESGQTKIVQSCTILYNLPESHYLEFKGIVTNIGIYSTSGVLKNNFSGFFHVTTYNSSIESQKIPAGTHLGFVNINRFYDNTSE